MSKTSRSNVATENALGLATAYFIANHAAAGFQHSRAPSEAFRTLRLFVFLRVYSWLILVPHSALRTPHLPDAFDAITNRIRNPPKHIVEGAHAVDLDNAMKLVVFRDHGNRLRFVFVQALHDL